MSNIEAEIKRIALETVLPELQKLRVEILSGTALMTISETAKHFGVSEKSIYNWMRRKDNPLEPVRLGDLIRFREVDVIEWGKEDSGRKFAKK